MAQPNQPVAKLPEYDKIRQQTQQRFQSQGQQQSDALQRRMASLGNLKSGAAIKQQQMLQSDLNKDRESALGQIDVQEAGELQRRQEVQDNRDFAAMEALKGRDFAAGESALGRKFAASESALGRALQSDQFAKTFQEQVAQNKFMNKMAKDEFNFNKKATYANQAKTLAELEPDQYRLYLDNLFNLDKSQLTPDQRRARQSALKKDPDALRRLGKSLG